MINKIKEGIYIGTGIFLSLIALFSIVYAVGFHSTSDIISGTFVGDYIFNGTLEVNGQISSSNIESLTPTNSNLTLNWGSGNSKVIDLESLSNNLNLTFTNTTTGGSYVIKFIQGSSAKNVTWPVNSYWPQGNEITLTQTNDAIDIVSIFYDGSNYYIAGANNYS